MPAGPGTLSLPKSCDRSSSFRTDATAYTTRMRAARRGAACGARLGRRTPHDTRARAGGRLRDLAL